MTGPERQARIDQLFFDAINLSCPDQESFLERHCEGDPTLREEVEQLLEADSQANTQLFAPAPVNVGRLVDTAADDVRVGEQIGEYVLQSRIASGGFGTVYRALREEPYQEQVAIKLMHRDKLGSPDIVKRVVREMQALSDLRHECIVQQLHSGITDGGEPYIVMEYIEGLPLCHHCDEQQLQIDERLKLFQSICNAVQYAHDRNWVHRDLKPGNILVTRDGKPKLLDFGIAKFVSLPGENDDATALTMSPIGTPQYMSPEQLLDEEVGTPSDVYSLGMILYELVSGHRVYDVLCGDKTSYAFGELQKAVQSKSPSRPSDAIAFESTGDGVSAETISTYRGTSSLRLRQSLTGDIDNIVMMALRREPSRRYESPQALAEDIQAWEERRPVKARPETISYRSQRWFQRNKVMVALVLMFACFVGASLTAYFKPANDPDLENRFAIVTESQAIESFNAAQSQSRVSLTDAQADVRLDDYRGAVVNYYEAYSGCPGSAAKGSYLRLLHSWIAYLGYPLFDQANTRGGFSESGKLLWVALPTGEVRIWDLERRKVRAEFDVGGFVTEAQFGTNEAELALKVDDDGFQIWSTDGKRLAIHEFPGRIAGMGYGDGCWSVLSTQEQQITLSRPNVSHGPMIMRAQRTIQDGWFASHLSQSQFLFAEGLILATLTDTKLMEFDPRRPTPFAKTKAELWHSVDLTFVAEVADPNPGVSAYLVSGRRIGLVSASISTVFDVRERKTIANLEGRIVGLSGAGDHAMFYKANKLFEWEESELSSSKVLANIQGHQSGSLWRYSTQFGGIMLWPNIESDMAFEYAGLQWTPMPKRRFQHPIKLPRKRVAPRHEGLEYDRLQSDRVGQNIMFRRIRDDPITKANPGFQHNTTVPWLWQTEPFQLPSPPGKVNELLIDLAVDEGGNRFALAFEGKIEIWDTTANMPKVLDLHGKSKPVEVALHSGRGILVTGHENGSRFVWDAQTLEQLSTLPGDNAIQDMRLSSDGDQLLATTRHELLTYDLTDDDTPERYSRGVDEGAYGDARFVAKNTILVNAGSNLLLKTPSSSETTQTDGVTLAFGQCHGEVCAVTVFNNGVQLQRGLREAKSLKIPKQDVATAAMSPGGEVFVLGFNNGTVQFWDTYLCEPMSQYSVAGTNRVSHLAFSLDGRVLVSVCDDGQIHRWRTMTAPFDSNAEKLKARVEMTTGLNLDAANPTKQRLTYAEWQVRYKHLFPN